MQRDVQINHNHLQMIQVQAFHPLFAEMKCALYMAVSVIKRNSSSSLRLVKPIAAKRESKY